MDVVFIIIEFQFEYKPGSTHSNADTLSRTSSAVPAVASTHPWMDRQHILSLSQVIMYLTCYVLFCI